ncbi:MAG: DUF5673 domain-containing protein [Gallicola sp.]|nr:DUF5673 domain-containing protein [Gallicola sp.]
MGSQGQNIFEILFILVLLFVGKQMYDGYKNRKKLEDPVQSFSQRIRMMMAISSGALFALGVFYLVVDFNLMAIVYVILGVAFIYLTYEKILIGANGIYYNGKLTLWSDIKQWGFGEDGKFLHLQVLDKGKKAARMIPVRPGDQEAINSLIRHHKKRKK